MVPTPQVPTATAPDGSPAAALTGESVVISGMSGLFPQSHHVKELSEILYNKVNPITKTTRWISNHPEVAQYTGNVPELALFDAQFFKVHYRLGNSMDSMGRKVLEQAYQAIYDAGVSPQQLNGRKVGVYIGSCFSETEKSCFYVASSRTGFGIAGCSKTMFANRISYWLNAKGPSMAVDDACCSSTVALEQAFLDISRGECEAAIVGGANLCLHPQSSVHYGRIISLCMDGKTKSFDQNADGCAKSEAINVLFLQKAKDAKRVYAEVINVKCEFVAFLDGETGPRYGFYRDPLKMVKFLNKFYKDANVSPLAVEYVEAFGSAVPEADKAELESIDEVFCKGRHDALLVGTVMSNIGYSEAASGISGITKVLLAYETGQLAGNLHCDNPRQDIAALREGRMEILTDNQKFGRAYTAVNTISVTGCNAHVLLHGQYRPKDPNRYKSNIPYLVTISGRMDSSVQKILDDLKSRPIDPEELALLHNIHVNKISGHLGRGYTILGTNEEQQTVSLVEKASYFDEAKRPLWFVYSGMGSQWAGMGSQLMRIPIFAAAIERCRKVLEPKGVDIVDILTSPDKTMFDNILNSFVGIAAVQIGLTDILKSLGIEPDMIIGHSVGELGCAYADGCFTAEEMILSAYSRGLVSVQTPFIRGSMAAVGIGYQQVSQLVPPEIEVACHNGPESSTISGPADIMREFVTKLTEQGIFAKEVPCSNIAYHSRYIAEAGPALLKYLSEVIKDPKPRSKRWLSTSVPEKKWDDPKAQTSSAYYHTNNLLSPVLFEETCKMIPSNAVLVEIAPHGLLQAILKRSLPETCRHIPLTRRGHSDNVLMVLDAVGKLYMEGYNPQVAALYPAVEFPVSTGTPMLSHQVEWAHHETWGLPLYVEARRKQAAACKFVISYHDEEYSYLQGSVLRGKTVYPFSAALVAAWDTLAMSLNLSRKQLSVEYTDLHLFAQPPLLDQRQLRLSVTLHRGTGRFEIMEDNSKVVVGFISGQMRDDTRGFQLPFESNEDLVMNSKDIYQLLHERDYFFTGDFRSIHRANCSLTEAQIIWNKNWVTFLDGVLQLKALRCDSVSVSQPFQIRRICIDIKRHFEETIMEEVDGKTVMTANVFERGDITRCGGLLIEGMKFKSLPALKEDAVTLKALKFVPRIQSYIDVPNALQIFLQIVSENINKETINVLGIVNYNEDTVFNEIRTILGDVCGLKVNYEEMKRDTVLSMRDYFLTEVDLVLVQDLTSDDSLCQILYRILPRDMFIVNGEETNEDRVPPSTLYRVVSALNSNYTKLELMRWRPTQASAASTVVTVRSHSDLALLTVTRDDLTQRHRLVVISPYPAVPGLKELVKQWRRDTDRNEIYLVMISENDHLDQLPELDLAINVLSNGVWGGEYSLPCYERVKVERGLTLRSARIGDLESLHWVEALESSQPGVAVDVHYAAINDIDAKTATGVISLKAGTESETSYGLDFSGTTDSGQRVMGIVSSGAVSGRVVARPELLWPVPEHWTLEDAATVPSAYALAFYCLSIKVKFRAGLAILVHGGAGALGQAAISIGLAHGCEVFTTVSDIRKKRFLLKLFPGLKEDHVGNSRDATFEDMVRVATKGKCCDVVICCVKGELKHVSLNCCGLCCIFLDLVQIPNHEQFAFGMSFLTYERNYVRIDQTSVFTDHVDEMKKIQELMSEGIARGYVRPLSRVTYAPHDAARAFRLLAASRHRGRVLLRLRDSHEGTKTVAHPRLSCSPDLCQLLLCNEDAFGIQLADRLVHRGARKLLLHFSNVPTHLRFKIQSWEKIGVKVQVSSVDLSTKKGIVTLLTDSNRLGPIEGVFVNATSVTKKTIDSVNTTVASLDLASRKLCPAIKYFAVVSAGVSIGQDTCMSRVQDSLPATILNLHTLRKVGNITSPEDKQALTWRSAVDATERALRSPQPALLAHSQKVVQPTLLQQIAVIADINLSEDYEDSIPLHDFGLELAKVPAVCTLLSDVHNVSLAEDIVHTLTIRQIREIEESVIGCEFKDVKGLETYFSYVDPDEMLATCEMEFPPTLTHSTTTREDELDVSQTYLCIVPGMDGHHSRFRLMCERLKLPVLVLQPGLDHLYETYRETAERYAKVLLKKLELKDNFYLLGYEYGVAIALEMSAILESHGLKGTVFCVGGTPEEIQANVVEQLREYDTEEALQNAVATHMSSLMTGNTDGIDRALKNAFSWREKIDSCVRSLLGQVAHSAQYARSLIEGAYTMVQQARTYKIEPKSLKSKLVLLHASSMSDPSGMGPELLLQRYSQQPVVVHEMDTPLARIIKDLRCSTIINKYLSPEILNDFEQRNLCETYLLNADVFLSCVEDNPDGTVL